MSNEETKQITIRGRDEADEAMFDRLLRQYLGTRLGKVIAVSVREKGVNSLHSYPEPYNLRLEKVEGNRAYFSIPIAKIVGVDDQAY